MDISRFFTSASSPPGIPLDPLFSDAMLLRFLTPHFLEQESEQAEFERRKHERDEAADAKTAKNRAKRQKRKAARKKGSGKNGSGSDSNSNSDRGEDEGEIKKKRILGGDGKGIVFRWPGEEDNGNVGEDDDIGPSLPEHTSVSKAYAVEEDPTTAVVDNPAIVIHDSD